MDGVTGAVVKSVTKKNGIHGIKGAIESKAKRFNKNHDNGLAETIRAHVEEDKGFECEEKGVAEGQFEGWIECK